MQNLAANMTQIEVGEAMTKQPQDGYCVFVLGHDHWLSQGVVISQRILEDFKGFILKSSILQLKMFQNGAQFGVLITSKLTCGTNGRPAT